MLDDLCLDDLGAREFRCEIDFDHATAKRRRRRERFQRPIDPLRCRPGKVEIAIEAFDHALAAERSKARIDCLAYGAAPARKPESQARCVGLADPTTRLSRSISSSGNGALLGMIERLAGIGLVPSPRTGAAPREWCPASFSAPHHGMRGKTPATMRAMKTMAAATAHAARESREKRAK